jgi:Domain of unknown function (DUF4439)
MTPLESLQRTLAGEHAAVYVFGVLGARVSQSKQPSLAAQLTAAYTVHRGRRDQLVALVRTAHGDPVAAALSYSLPNAADTDVRLRHAALVTEQRCSAVYAQLVGSTSGTDRQWALRALDDSAVRQLSFGADPSPYPGIPELG